MTRPVPHIVVFLGPTLPVADARAILPHAAYLPPAAQSDLLSVVEQSRPDAIALIDGVFTQALSVWHKEILYALERGVAVYGASSMGALRIAETAAFGAVGVGRIYEGYAGGALTDDDEVAVVHATTDWGYRCLSEAMVNIRASLAAARDAGVIDPEAHDRLVGLAKARFYPKRSYPQLFEDAARAGFDPGLIDALGAFLATSAVDQKREDALALLAHLRDQGVTAPTAGPVTRSHVFQSLYHRDRRVERGTVQLPLSDISSHAALHLEGFGQINEHALHAALVDVLAEFLHVEADPEALAAERKRFCAERRLHAGEDLVRWRTDNDLSEEALDEFIARQARRRCMRDWYISRKHLERTTQEVLDELRLDGRYPAAADAAAAQQDLLAASQPYFEFTGDDTPLRDLIRDHARATPWHPTTAIDVWAFENGFKGPADVRYELIRAKLAREDTASALSALAGAAGADPGGLDGR